MIHAPYSASNLRARAEKIKKPLFKQTQKVTFHIITLLGVVFSLSTLISKLSRPKIIGSFKLQVSLWLADLIEKSRFSGRRYFSRLRRSWRLRCQISLEYYTIQTATQAKINESMKTIPERYPSSTAFFEQPRQFVYIYSRSSPLHAGWRKSDSSVDGEPQGNGRRNSNSKGVVVSFTSFSRPATRAPRRVCSQANGGTAVIHQESIYKNSEGWGEGKWLRSKILLNFYNTNYPLFFFVDMHLFASFRNKKLR